MLTYQIKERIIRIESEIVFPNNIELNIHFHPNSAFGSINSEGRTWKQSTPGSVIFNANSGHFKINPQNTIDPLEVIIEYSDTKYQLKENHFQIQKHCENLTTLTQLIDNLYYIFPYILSFTFRDTITIERVDGLIGTTNFRWELSRLNIPIILTNQQKQEDAFVKALDFMQGPSPIQNRRLLAALKYYYTACRLNRVGNTPWEYMSEIILNFCKVLESLFPATRDSVREGLLKLNYSSEEIEEFFIPIMLLRSKIDSGHVFLALFSQSELNSLHLFTEIIENKIHEMLVRLFEKIELKEFEIQDYIISSATKEEKNIINSISKTVQKFNQKQ